MAEKTAIAWAYGTHNPWEGCQRVSEACDHCYAERRDNWIHKGVHWGPHGARKPMSKSYLRQPYKWDRDAAALGERRRIFPSLCDPFDNHKSIKQEWRDEHWQMIRDTPNLDHLLLTKRPQNIPRFLPTDWGDGYPNVWLGTTVESQTQAKIRLPKLLDVSAKVHFVSMEPLLDAVDLTEIYIPAAASVPMHAHNALSGVTKTRSSIGELRTDSMLDKLSWVIAGGESGPNFRPSDPAWFLSLRDQCVAADVPFFFKQYGGKTRKEIDAKGRLLDGVWWDQVPTPVEDVK